MTGRSKLCRYSNKYTRITHSNGKIYVYMRKSERSETEASIIIRLFSVISRRQIAMTRGKTLKCDTQALDGSFRQLVKKNR